MTGLPARGAETGGGSDRRDAFVLFVLGMAGFLALALIFPVISPDGFIYLELAKNLPVSGYEVMGEPHAKFLPLYPALMAGLDLVGGRLLSLDWWGRLISVISGAALPPLLFLLARRLTASRFAALLTAAMLALMAVGWDQYRDVNVMPIFTFLFMAGFYGLARERFFSAGIIMGLALTTRYETELFIPVFILANLGNRRALALFFIGLVLASSPWWVRNLIVYGSPGKTYYWAELMNFRFHLAAIALDTVKDFGPVALIAAAIGAARLERKFKLYLFGFGALYTVLHGVWWYQDRFLLPLMPVVLVPAALGVDQALQWSESRWPGGKGTRRIVALLLAAPLLVIAALYLYGLAVLPQDQMLEAASSLTSEPPDQAVVGANALLLKYYAGRPADSWKDLPLDTDPNKFILSRRRERNVRWIVWLNRSPVDWQVFGFLKDGRDHSAVVPAPDGTYRVS